ncbi:ribbon-helix-helix protein, CopG family [Microcoleus sp. FACHB-SPT15]|uniref:ribbon-helix-helix protein, CopG family n=1 Tax=Microcoleus sp. FACHB-SPT15 TaxID=2692830 RepID=UPI00177C61D1|nr:ribbon-helix-helix protein, CopG family [Microcoleus sp. FACHB-SPT15]MBD1804189.1 ribbon-helix-helix protein, CopG family [Microcoleus sp. FACHB-SPT15]
MTKVSVVTKRDDPNYSQVSGYVPKDLARRFRIACTSKEISQSEALEEALEQWLEKDNPSLTKKGKGKE